ncbi:hypothetical protein [Bacillus alkalicellulosilyticus]|uniref:hypothetical protein n=1 Tax=Alkalihalobacterium alkalicellulosilyticum TaxID=1912214 RepID=UPI00099824B3|nr:hypothetical protein [Bacillus alkalicellulosilyticus]
MDITQFVFILLLIIYLTYHIKKNYNNFSDEEKDNLKTEVKTSPIRFFFVVLTSSGMIVFTIGLILERDLIKAIGFLFVVINGYLGVCQIWEERKGRSLLLFCISTIGLILFYIFYIR